MTERSSRRDSLASHTVLVAGALGIAQIAAYAVSVVAARALGPDGFGVLAALLGILLIGSVLAMGIQAVAARRLVQVDAA
jgi:O-antigen/teichoic acid export membrane protein